MKFIYIDGGNVLPPAGLAACKNEAMGSAPNNKRIKISFPYSFRKGMNFLVLKLDFKKNNGFSLANSFDELFKHDGVLIKENGKQLLIYYPVTMLDDLKLNLDLLPGTKLHAVSHAIISADEFFEIKAGSKTLKKMDNLGFLKYCLTLRKDYPDDELYDLNEDMEMSNNLFPAHGYPFEDQIYAIFKDLRKKRNRIFIKSGKEKVYSRSEIENLKSLGYL